MSLPPPFGPPTSDDWKFKEVAFCVYPFVASALAGFGAMHLAAMIFEKPWRAVEGKASN
jgi:hypothetical protein